MNLAGREALPVLHIGARMEASGGPCSVIQLWVLAFLPALPWKEQCLAEFGVPVCYNFSSLQQGDRQSPALIDCLSPFLPQCHPPIPFLGQSQRVWIDIPLGWYPSWDWADFVQSERAFAWICEIVVCGQCGPGATLICLYHLEIK